MDCHWRTFPRKLLLSSMIFTGACCSMIVPNSWSVICKPPSPQNTHTVRSGAPNVAPIAAGSPNPIVPMPPLVTTERGFEYLKYLQANIWFCPTSVTKMASLFVASEIFCTTSPIRRGPFSGCVALSMTLLYSFSAYGLNPAIQLSCFVASTSSVTAGIDSLQSPKMATSILTFLLNSEGSISKWMILACLA